MKIIPTILEKNWDEAEGKIERVKDKVSWIQIDVIDGNFLPEKTFELELVKKVFEESGINLLDIHLMVKEPIKWINKCKFVGASRIIGQVEMMSDREKFVNEIKDSGIEAGLAFDVETDIGEIPDEIDTVLLMGRRTGFGVFPFKKETWSKIKIVRQIQAEREGSFEIGVDGGINVDNIKRLKDEGVDLAYCGGAVFGGDVEKNLEKLKIE